MNTEKVRRPFGAGSVERDRHKFRARIRTINGKTTLGTFDTEAEAHEVLDAYFLDRAEKKAPLASVVSIKTIGPKFLDFRESRGLRSVDTDRDRWNAHIATAFFAEWPLREVSAKNVREWRDALMGKRATRVVKGGTKLIPKRAATKRRLSRSSRKSTLNLLRQAFEWAIEQDLIPANPAHGIKLEKELRTEDPWTFLTLDEQTAITTTPDIPLPERTIVKFLIGTGLRKGEAWALRLCDVHVKGERPHVMVRFGSPGKPPKNGKIRRVPLFGAGLEAATEWLAALPAYAKRNPLGLMFPTRRGYRRHRRVFRAEWRDAAGKRLAGRRTMTWPEMLAAAGIARSVRIHDLRHTCGSSLVAGWWGRVWTLVEVRDLLGHSQISVTERYAHLAQSALEKAARETVPSAPHLARGESGADRV
jgi:integrase